MDDPPDGREAIGDRVEAGALLDGEASRQQEKPRGWGLDGTENPNHGP